MNSLFIRFNIAFGLFAVSMFPSNTFAYELSCSPVGYSVTTINGVLTNEDGARFNKDNLKKILPGTFKGEKLTVDYLLNPSHVAGLGDLATAAMQKFFEEETVQDYDLVKILNSASEKVKTQKLLLVAHSQGNFYANSFYDVVAGKQGGLPVQSIAVYGVANPASRVAGGGKWLTSDTDNVITGIVQNLALTRSIMPPNTRIPEVASWWNPFAGHGFSDVYLAYESKRMMKDIEESLSNLSIDPTKRNDLLCISPQKISVAHKTEGVVLALADGAVDIARGSSKNMVHQVYATTMLVSRAGNALAASLWDSGARVARGVVEVGSVVSDNPGVIVDGISEGLGASVFDAVQGGQRGSDKETNGMNNLVQKNAQVAHVSNSLDQSQNTTTYEAGRGQNVNHTKEVAAIKHGEDVQVHTKFSPPTSSTRPITVKLSEKKKNIDSPFSATPKITFSTVAQANAGEQYSSTNTKSESPTASARTVSNTTTSSTTGNTTTKSNSSSKNTTSSTSSSKNTSSRQTTSSSNSTSHLSSGPSVSLGGGSTVSAGSNGGGSTSLGGQVLAATIATNVSSGAGSSGAESTGAILAAPVLSAAGCATSLAVDGCLLTTTTLHFEWTGPPEARQYGISKNGTYATTTGTVFETNVSDFSTYTFAVTAINANGLTSATSTQVISVATIPLVINEVAWAGTSASANDEWFELKNNTGLTIDLSSWEFVATDGSPHVLLSGTVLPRAYAVFERTDDSTITEVVATQTYTGALSNAGEELKLVRAGTIIDQTPPGIWVAGESGVTKKSMERVSSVVPGTLLANWKTNDGVTKNGTDATGNPILGTPGSTNSLGVDPIVLTADATPPVITMTGATSTTLVAGSSYVDLGASAIDGTDGTLTVDTTSVVDASLPGTYHVVYVVTDLSGNTATSTRTVIVMPAGRQINFDVNHKIDHAGDFLVCDVDAQVPFASGNNAGVTTWVSSTNWQTQYQATANTNMPINTNFRFIFGVPAETDADCRSGARAKPHSNTFRYLTSSGDSVVYDSISLNFITAFALPSITGATSTIDSPPNAITLTVPRGTNVTALAPEITVSLGASIYPASGVLQDFTTPVMYTVTAMDGSVRTYTVSVSFIGRMFTFDGAHRVSYVGDFILCNTDANISGVNGNNAGVTSWISSANWQTQYQATANTNMPVNTNFRFVFGDNTQSSSDCRNGTYINDYSNDFYYQTPLGSSVVYGRYAAQPQSSAKAITSFALDGISPVVSGTLDETAHTVTLSVSSGTDVRALAPSITVSSLATTSPASGVVQDFTNPVIYTVIAEDGSTQTYTITVTSASSATPATIPSVTNYTFNGVVGNIVVDFATITPVVDLVFTASENVNWLSVTIESVNTSTDSKTFFSGTTCVDGGTSCAKTWDGILSNGSPAANGTYRVKAHIQNATGGSFNDQLTPYVITVQR